jgi:callose synthase
VGLFSHLGEIRSIEQLRLRFQFFASAMEFNLMPEQQPFETRNSIRSKFRDAINRLKLRYGFGRPYRTIEANEVQAKRFALIWNEIILMFREEDIISDREVELLEIPPDLWDVRVIRWPCLLLCNELLLALGQATELVASDRSHWRTICQNEYRRCAVIEAYDSVRYLLLRIIRDETTEHRIIEGLFRNYEEAIQAGQFTVEYKLTVLPRIHSNLITLLDLILYQKKDLTKVVNTLQTLYDIVVRDFPINDVKTAQLKQIGFKRSTTGLLFEHVIELPGDEDAVFYRQVRRLHTILTYRDSMNDVPKNLEARRRITFFSNSLFMNMPRAPCVEKMNAFSVLTPYYSEDVLFAKEQLRSENEDGISILFYLQKIYADDWANFLERMKREGMVSEDEIWGEKLRDLRLWASYRGQTLARTVRGMMYYYKALNMLTYLDSASEIDIREGTRELASLGSYRYDVPALLKYPKDC